MHHEVEAELKKLWSKILIYAESKVCFKLMFNKLSFSLADVITSLKLLFISCLLFQANYHLCLRCVNVSLIFDSLSIFGFLHNLQTVL